MLHCRIDPSLELDVILVVVSACVTEIIKLV